MKEFYSKMLKTGQYADIKILTDEHCCKLLSWLYGYGGSMEAVLFNYKLNEDIKHSQERLNIFGGEIVNPELHTLLKSYLKEVENALAGKGNHPKWAYDICDHYGLSNSCIA